MALEDWGFYLKGTKPGAIVVPATATEPWQAEMAREYLSAVIQALKYYSVPVSQEMLMGNGELAVTTSAYIFQVVKVHQGQSRTKVIHTVHSASDKSVVSG